MSNVIRYIAISKSNSIGDFREDGHRKTDLHSLISFKDNYPSKIPMPALLTSYKNQLIKFRDNK